MKDNNEKYGKYLPIGSVVMLKDATKRLMITGYCVSEKANPEKTFDYSGCLYPEGFLSSEQTCLFDHAQIAKIYCIGYTDEEQQKFMETLKELANKMGK